MAYCEIASKIKSNYPLNFDGPSERYCAELKARCLRGMQSCDFLEIIGSANVKHVSRDRKEYLKLSLLFARPSDVAVFLVCMRPRLYEAHTITYPLLSGKINEILRIVDREPR